MIAANPLDLTAPDNTGSDTLQRYRYQAQLIFPYCLDCAIHDRITSVLPEHFEDVLIEYPDAWHFIQIKTRNQNLGPWKLSDALDGLRSLWRTHESIQHINTIKTNYALFLEGAIAKDDPLNELVPLEGQKASIANIPPILTAKVMKDLSVEESKCNEFLARTTVQANQSTRQDIAARNIRLLSQMASSASSTEIEAIYGKLVNQILEAMAADKLDSELPAYIANPNSVGLPKVIKKRLTRTIIKTLLGSLAFGSSLLLQRMVELNTPCPTNLELKLLAGGAEHDSIKYAKGLRASASAREAQLLSANYDDDLLEDVRNRLLVMASSIIQKHALDKRPAVEAYHELLMTLMEKAANCDPNRVFRQDPYFLLGEVCALSDECKIDWGSINA